MIELQEEMDALIAAHKEMKRNFQKSAQQKLKECMVGFFDANPGIKTIIWTQYTPYFNDGDECVFGVNEPYFTNASLELAKEKIHWGEYEHDGEDDEKEIWSVYDVGYVLNHKNEKWYKKNAELILSGEKVDPELCDWFSKLITASDMVDVLREMFDDHSIVYATREGFTVGKCDHD